MNSAGENVALHNKSFILHCNKTVGALTMTNPTAEINAFLEQSKTLAEPLSRLALLSVNSFEKLARHHYGVTGDALEYSIAALQTGAATREASESLKSQTTLAQHYIDRQNERAQALTKLADEIRSDYGRWFEQASGQFKRKDPPVPDAA